MQLANGGEIEIVPAYQIMRVSPEDKISLKRLHSIKTDDFVLSRARERERETQCGRNDFLHEASLSSTIGDARAILTRSSDRSMTMRGTKRTLNVLARY